MATEKQIAANRKNAARSTGPRTMSGKKRSSKNALRHGLAASLDGQGATSESDLDLEMLSERMALIESERAKLTFEIETMLWEESDKAIDALVHKLDALERYAKRSSSALRKRK
jgi:hypothetical protein